MNHILKRKEIILPVMCIDHIVPNQCAILCYPQFFYLLIFGLQIAQRLVE